MYIWTDCDREGEHIGAEAIAIARKANPRIEIKRARFSNLERAHIIQAAQNPIAMDNRQVDAVNARMELDLRIGAAFTRFQTLTLQKLGPQFAKKVISYGSCQFPTLGFVVDRWKRVKNFVPEPFWYIKVVVEQDDQIVQFRWKRGHLFDRHATIVLYERCLMGATARVASVVRKPTTKFRPFPLTTVELQKQGTRFLGLSSHQIMTIAERLYTRGFISYPRTETDQFDKEMDLRALIQKQVGDDDWGVYSQDLLNGSFKTPRNGRHNDKAHPPIHPVIHVARSALTPDEYKVYAFITRRFLACCSDDAKGESTSVELNWEGERFVASGILVIARNYLDIYPYDKWESSEQLPNFIQGHTITPKEAEICEGKTTRPNYLTEPELIGLMEANGIGTDATMADHIAKIEEREYVRSLSSSSALTNGVDAENDDGEVTRGRGRGRGTARGRGSRANGRGGARAGVKTFVPSNLGITLVDGYDSMQFEESLSKPHLRKEVCAIS